MTRLALLMLLLGFAGCGWKTDGLLRLEELYPTPMPKDAGSDVIDIGEPRCSGLTGTWAVRLLQQGTIAPLGEPWKMTINDTFLAEGNDSAFSLRFCDQSVSIVPSGSSGPTDLGRTEIPDALKTTLYGTPLQVALRGDGTFAATDVIWLWGLKNLANPLTDPLPTKDNYLGDARVFDQDNDSHPGASIHVVAPVGDRYMVRRAVWTFAPGKLTLDSQWLTGELSSKVDESGLEATNSLLLTPAPITPKPGTVYQMRCVGSTYTCPSLATQFPALFKDAPR